ncbi:MAG: HAMP domain-containing histidine kinase [Deltaproteobacteria bacterium]|nr:HAMP domain-containing histidine kinase [Deltaproteobacteria bacterium]
MRVNSTVEYLIEVSRNLEKISDDNLKKFIDVYRVGNRRMWLEDPDGGVLFGEPWPGMTAGVREQVIDRRYVFESASALVLKTVEPSLVIRVESLRDGRPVVVCFNWQRSTLVQHWGVFVQGVLGLIGLSLVLSLFTSKRISKPLQDLRAQVMTVASGDLSLRLPETGEDEVADVSKAVNYLTDSLSSHMTGMRQLMANMSHEMRSCVANLSMCLEMLSGQLPPAAVAPLSSSNGEPSSKPPAGFHEPLNQARLEVELLKNMVASGLLGGKLDLRHEELEPAPLDFSSLCRQVLGRYRHRSSLKAVPINAHIETDRWLLGDELLLDRLLDNILDNALKYTGPSGEITFSLKARPNELVVESINTHPPLTAEQLANLCLPYYRAEEGRVYGSGLGLYLVKKIALLHCGSVEVSNCDQGVAVTIRLPLPADI